jgi:dUTP pyrophosphatase
MTEGAAGMDLYADIEEEIILSPLARSLIPTGLALALPKGYEAQVRPRSGLAFRSGLTVLNAPGTIDADYRDEVKVLIINFGEKPVCLKRGDRIAQLVIAPVLHAYWEEITELTPTGRRGGFGHTGE